MIARIFIAVLLLTLAAPAYAGCYPRHHFVEWPRHQVNKWLPCYGRAGRVVR